jgi:protein gp37
MSAKTPIEWTDRTWNPLAAFLKHDVFVTTKDGGKKLIPAGTRGWFCTKCSPGCAHCYAEKINLRLGNGLEYAVKNLDEIEFRLVGLHAPLRWRKPQRVFVNSMTDMFHEAVPDHLIDQVFAAMAHAPHVTFQILTKRAKRMREFLNQEHRKAGKSTMLSYYPDSSDPKWPLPNVWLGVSAENQACADERIRELLATPAAVRFLSVEPLLGPVDLELTAKDAEGAKYAGNLRALGDLRGLIDWVIIGCESRGKKAGRNTGHYESHARRLILQCAEAGVACFHKQMPIDGNVSHDMNTWPDDLRVRQFPKVREGGPPSPTGGPPVLPKASGLEGVAHGSH